MIQSTEIPTINNEKLKELLKLHRPLDNYSIPRDPVEEWVEENHAQFRDKGVVFLREMFFDDFFSSNPDIEEIWLETSFPTHDEHHEIYEFDALENLLYKFPPIPNQDDEYRWAGLGDFDFMKENHKDRSTGKKLSKEKILENNQIIETLEKFERQIGHYSEEFGTILVSIREFSSQETNMRLEDFSTKLIKF